MDITGGAIPAIVRVLQQNPDSAVLRFPAGNNGAFQTGPLPAGVYSLTLFCPGFRRRELRNVVIEAGHTTTLGEIRLDLSGCDAPGTICDYVGAVPESVKRIIAEAYVTLTLSCAVHLDRKGATVCPERGGPTKVPKADLRLAKKNATLYLVPENGAAVSTDVSPTDHCSLATYGSDPLPVAGLGPGVDFCVRTKRGSVSHVFFTGDVENESTAVSLWYVTRR